MNAAKNKKGLFSIIVNFFRRTVRFLTEDIWRINPAKDTMTWKILMRILQTLMLSVRHFSEDRLMVKASALTYYTLFAIVPVVALVLAIGRGFGIQELIVEHLSKSMSTQEGVLDYILQFVDNYLERAKGGVFVGVGIIMLLWSVISCFRNVESVVDDIWRVSKTRSIWSQFTSYLSLMLILPVLMVASGGLSVFLSSAFSNEFFGPLSPILVRMVKLLPYFINWLTFTALFIIVPNTRVRFLPALSAGLFTGVFFQLFQFLYIKGQVLLTSYNAVYGGFAVIPLLLLWLQISWVIILLGAELSYAAQNAEYYESETDLRNLSRRYRDFALLGIMTLITKQFSEGQTPPDAESIARDNAMPIRLVQTSLNRLLQVGLIYAVESNTASAPVRYAPSLDINLLTIGFFFKRINEYGGEPFDIHQKENFRKAWCQLQSLHHRIENSETTVLLKDL
ncbi:MAG: YihY/virulence factor BrkB family protein [Paludibacteraceae bacterium]|nr:YihY/virulence factor BrkB family protein [Paludibacteraceae bacterium]